MHVTKSYLKETTKIHPKRKNISTSVETHLNTGVLPNPDVFRHYLTRIIIIGILNIQENPKKKNRTIFIKPNPSFIIQETKYSHGIMEYIIETNSLTKNFGELTAVNTVTLNVRKGSLFGLLGPNGSGKTTMIKMLTGQIVPSFGNAHVLGLDVAIDPVGIRTLVGIIPEQETPPSFLTSMEYLEFIAEIRNIQDITKKAAWWFDFLDFGDKRDVLCKDLSRGTRQKLMLTQAFIHEPELALIDEPLINFDPIMQAKVKDFFVSYVQKGNTLFLSTHLLETAEEICSDIAILHTGNLLFSGTIGEILKDGRHLPDFFLSLVRSR